MTILATLAALQTAHLAISGVASAPTEMPSNLDRVVLPVVLVWPGEANWKLQTVGGLRRQERTYIVRCYVQTITLGIAGPDAGYQKCAAMLNAFGVAYFADITLGGVVDHITTLQDAGISGGGYELMWGQVPYWGFVFRVTVVEKST